MVLNAELNTQDLEMVLYEATLLWAMSDGYPNMLSYSPSYDLFHFAGGITYKGKHMYGFFTISFDNKCGIYNITKKNESQYSKYKEGINTCLIHYRDVDFEVKAFNPRDLELNMQLLNRFWTRKNIDIGQFDYKGGASNLVSQLKVLYGFNINSI